MKRLATSFEDRVSLTPLTLLGNLLEHPEERLCGISTQRGQVLRDQQVEELADVGKATNITNGIAKVELKVQSSLVKS